jgi:hypothetical protein
MFGVRYFTMLCNNAEYKRMDQNLNPDQLYDVHNMKYKTLVGPTNSLCH